MYSLKLEPNRRARCWVAKITGKCETYHFAREFLNAKIDYREKKSRYDRDIPHYYELEQGNLYEISEPMRKGEDRYFARITPTNELERLPMKEVEAALKLIEMEKSLSRAQCAISRF